MPMAAVDLAGFSDAVGRHVDAVLGADLINASILGLDVGRGVFELIPANARPNMPVEPIPLAKGQVEMTVGGKPVRLTIDLGFVGELTLTPEAWARVGPPDAKKETHLLAHVEGQAFSVDHASLPQVSIGGIERKDVGVDIRAVPARDGDGWIGMGLMSQFVMLMDVTGGKLWLMPRPPSTPATAPPAAAPPSGSSDPVPPASPQP